MATTFTVLPEAVRGSLAFGHAGDPQPTPLHVPAGAPQFVTIAFPSVDWATPGHTMSVTLEVSYDGGATWVGFGGFGGAASGPVFRVGAPPYPTMRVSWDGRALDLRGAVVVDAPFSWGITLTV